MHNITIALQDVSESIIFYYPIRTPNMGLFITFIIIAALASFIFYNMDQMNKMSADIRFIKGELLQKHTDREIDVIQEATQKSN